MVNEYWLMGRDSVDAHIKDNANRFSNARLLSESYAASVNADGSVEGIMSVVVGTGVATITVKGVLVSDINPMARFFGSNEMSYGSIIDAIASADSNEDVSEIHMIFDCNGGEYFGIFAAVDAINNSVKPIKAFVHKALSAAYSLASQCDTIHAIDRSSVVGSTGVITQIYNDPSLIAVTNRDSSKKHPDPESSEGLSIIQDRLDAMYLRYARDVAFGRGVSINVVKDQFGQGDIVFPEEAMVSGMIDTYDERNSAPEVGADNGRSINSLTVSEDNILDLKTLKASHSDVYEAAVKEGADAERTRVSEHLQLGEASKSMDVAIKAIQDGVTAASMTVEYFSASMRTMALSNTQDDASSIGTVGLSSGQIGGQKQPAKDSIEQSVVDAVAALSGVKTND